MTSQYPAANRGFANPLTDRIAFVTGAGSGIGQAGAIAMARCGAHVVVTDRDAGAAQNTCDQILEEGLKASSLQLDVTDDQAFENALADTIKTYGRLDVLHSHVGVQIEGPLGEVSSDSMDLSWQLNVRAHFVAAKAVIGQMKAQGGGSIIITASNSGVQYDREMIAYATSKHAAVAMVRQMAADYAKDNIRFNALCPGFIDTPFNEGFEVQMGGRAQLEKYIAGSIPMGRFGTVEEMGDAIVFLASDMSSFMTGHALVIDGGECI